MQHRLEGRQALIAPVLGVELQPHRLVFRLAHGALGPTLGHLDHLAALHHSLGAGSCGGHYVLSFARQPGSHVVALFQQPPRRPQLLGNGLQGLP